jgi:hypothetical protein
MGTGYGSALAAVVLAVAGALPTCEPPKSHHPLTDPSKAKVDARLNGLWSEVRERGGDGMMLHFFPKGDTGWDIVLVGSDGEKGVGLMVFDAFPSSIGGQRYFNLRVKTFRGVYAEHAVVSSDYMFAKYALGKGGALTLWIMDADPVEVAIKAGNLQGVGEGTKTMILDTSEEIAKFVQAADSAKLFRQFGTFRKVPLPSTGEQRRR